MGGVFIKMEETKHIRHDRDNSTSRLFEPYLQATVAHACHILVIRFHDREQLLFEQIAILEMGNNCRNASNANYVDSRDPRVYFSRRGQTGSNPFKVNPARTLLSYRRKSHRIRAHFATLCTRP